MSQFPNVIGCLDGSYISCSTPAHKIRSTYANRYKQISITLQAICDSNRRFLDVFTGAPSKIHDARIYRMSPVSGQLQAICQGKYHILADGAYEIREWLLVPYKMYETLPAQQQKFNDRFCPTRVVIENAFSYLKKRFRQLIRIDMWSVDRISKFILSCCVLHNLCIDCDDNLEEEDDVNFEDDNRNEREQIPERRNESARDRYLRRLGKLKRAEICKSF